MGNEEYFEGSLIELDSGTLAPQAGWALGYVAIERVGSLVALHIEATNAAAAAAPVANLSGDYRPSATVTDTSGNFTLSAAGVLSFVGSTAAGALRVAQLVFKGALASP